MITPLLKKDTQLIRWGNYHKKIMELDKLNLQPLLDRIETLLKNQQSILVALDGRSGVGKSSIAKAMSQRFNCIIVVSDDFYSGGEGGDERGWDNKTAREKAEQAIDWKRLRSDVLEPLLRGENVAYHPFDFKRGIGLSKKEVRLEHAPLIILEGAYSSRPELQDIIDLSVLVESHDDERRGRLVNREGEAFMGDWHKRWDVAEDYYFSEIRPKEAFDFTIWN